MPDLKLASGVCYRVLASNARLCRMEPCGFAMTSKTRTLAPGEVITYNGSRLGWGSDPGAEAVFVTNDGWEGSLHPVGTWGGVSDTILASIIAAPFGPP